MSMMTHSRHSDFHVLFLFLLVLAASGCASVEKRDMVQSAAPALTENFSAQEQQKDAATPPQSAQTAREGWWTLYESPELNALVARAFKDNPNLNQTRARLDQANALARRTASDFWPEATLRGTRGDTRGDNHTPSDFSLVGAASYELDVWGKIRADAKSDALEAESGAEDVRTAAITLSASITENWLRLLAAREEETLLRKQIEINKTTLDLQHKRFALGAATALDVLQQKETLAASQAKLPGILATQDLLQHQIALLTGQSPSEPPPIAANKLPAPLPLPDSGIPSTLLAERPDIIASWLSLRAADWATEAAWRDRLPTFTLSATYTTTATALDGLFNTWLLDMAAQAALPLIDGGNRRAEALRQRAIADERFHAYRETVLSAVGDVEDALSQNRYQAEELGALEQQLEAARTTLHQAQVSYTNGDQDYLNVLNSLRSVQSLEQQIVEERLNLHLYRVALYRALGGRSWTGIALAKAEETS